jgi:tRNA (guanine37-N1)-methyltransferase
MKKKIWILSMFEDYFSPLKEFGVLGSALRNERGDGSLEFELIPVNLASFNAKGFKGVDDAPFGGGVGMIMRADILKEALIKGVVEPGGYTNIKDELQIICPSPRGKTWDNDMAKEFAKRNLNSSSQKDLVFICGRYEGIDERFLENYVDEFISLGNFILTGGELATMVILDSAMRFSPGVLGNKLSAVDESFAQSKLEYALYTRPRDFEGKGIPQELLSGDPKKISKFKDKSSLEVTKRFRPDLIDQD